MGCQSNTSAHDNASKIQHQQIAGVVLTQSTLAEFQFNIKSLNTFLVVIFIFPDRTAESPPIAVKATPSVGDGGDLDEEAAFSINIRINL